MRWPFVSRARLDDAWVALNEKNQRIAALEKQLHELHRETLLLAQKVAAPPPPVVPPSPPVIDPEASMLSAIKDETIDRMAAEFEKEGMDKALASDVARSLAREAEVLFG